MARRRLSGKRNPTQIKGCGGLAVTPSRKCKLFPKTCRLYAPTCLTEKRPISDKCRPATSSRSCGSPLEMRKRESRAPSTSRSSARRIQTVPARLPRPWPRDRSTSAPAPPACALSSSRSSNMQSCTCACGNTVCEGLRESLQATTQAMKRSGKTARPPREHRHTNVALHLLSPSS